MMAEASQPAEEFVEVEDAAALDQLFTRSMDAPVVLFKHSMTCPISARAYRQMSKLDHGAVGNVALVVVQHARAVSDEVARRTGVRHESPQVFILRGGKAVWHASHFDITSDSVERAVVENK
ncbi:MAG: bacillithiol system redox-active protein YtxJ [Pyrinomonadaceae bacterium]